MGWPKPKRPAVFAFDEAELAGNTAAHLLAQLQRSTHRSAADEQAQAAAIEYLLKRGLVLPTTEPDAGNRPGG
jgi:hypothetical protein